MNNFISSFSLYEFLRILMPGAYLALNLSQFIKYNFEDYNTILSGTYFNQVEATIIFVIVSVILGVFIYSIDNPKLLSRIFKNLPSNIIKDRHKDADSIAVMNSYFSFYDTMPDAAKMKTEQQSGFLHLSLDIIYVNIFSLLLILITLLIKNYSVELAAHTVLVSLLLLVSSTSAYFIYKKRLKFTYARNVEMYFQSAEYKLLLERTGKK